MTDNPETENVARTRVEMLSRLLQIPYDCLVPFKDPFYPRCILRMKECDTLIYGSLLRGFEQAGLWPRGEPLEVRYSVDVLADKIRALEVYTYPTEFGRNHKGCFTTKLKDEVETALRRLDRPILDEHLRHIQVQRAKLGEGVYTPYTYINMTEMLSV